MNLLKDLFENHQQDAVHFASIVIPPMTKLKMKEVVVVAVEPA